MVIPKTSLKGLCIKIGMWQKKIRRAHKDALKDERLAKFDLIRFPWEVSEREKFFRMRQLMERRKEDPNFKFKLMPYKYSRKHKPNTVGPGYPPLGLVYANLEIARGERERDIVKTSDDGLTVYYAPLKTSLPNPVPEDVFGEFCERIGIHKYNLMKTITEKQENAIDLKALDVYMEDIRMERNIILKEIKVLPLLNSVEVENLVDLEKSLFNIARSCYYSPFHSQVNSEDVVHLVVWILNRRNLPIAFQIKALQALSVIIYLSPLFKRELAKCGGIKVLHRLMEIGGIACSLLATWSCYTLAMGAVGCPEVIAEIQGTPDFDEIVGELSFELYWYYWPANFAKILQAMIYGPGGVANNMNMYEFF